MKMALAYHRARGQSSRTVFVSRERAYHGVNFSGVALPGIPTIDAGSLAACRRSFICAIRI